MPNLCGVVGRINKSNKQNNKNVHPKLSIYIKIWRGEGVISGCQGTMC